MKTKISGTQVIVPMVSPFSADYSIDEAAVGRMCEMFTKAGVSVFALGTTGEGRFYVAGTERNSGEAYS